MLSGFTKLDMHTHSEYSSDSKLPLDKIASFLEKNIDFGIILSDHNEINGALILQKRFPDRVIVGEEIRTDCGEITGLFLKEKIEPNRKLNWTIDAIIAQGGLVYIPHPKDRMRHSKLTDDGLIAAIKRADIIEAFNSRNVFGADDKKAAQMAKQYNLVSGCGSDAHTYGELGNSYVMFEKPFELNPDGLLDSINRAELVTRRTFQGIHVITKFNKIKNKYFRK